MGASGRPVQLSVQGPVTADVLDGVAHQIMDRISTVQGIKDATVSTPPLQPELDIVVDRLRCADAGISATTVGSTIATHGSRLGGDSSAVAGPPHRCHRSTPR